MALALLVACTAQPAPGPGTAVPHKQTAPPLAGPVKAGAVLSAALPAMGTARNGLTLAQEQVNARALLGAGATLDLIFADDGGQKEPAVNAVFQLINGEQVSALLGPALPYTTGAVAPLAQAAGVPMLAFGEEASGPPMPGAYVFRTALPAGAVISRTVAVAQQTLDLKTVAVLYDDSDSLTRAEYRLFEQALAAQGIQVSAREVFYGGGGDFSAALGRIQAAGADALVVVVFPEDGLRLLEQVRQAGGRMPLVGTRAFDAPQVAEAAGETPLLFGTTWCVCYTAAPNQEFVAAYRARFQADPDALAAQAYTAAWLLAAALQRAGTGNRVALQQALASAPASATPLGAFAFTATHDPDYAPYVVTVRDGALVLVAP